MDAALIQRVNSKLTDLAELQSREAATTLQRGWRQKRRAAAARRPPPAPSVSSLTGSLFGGRRNAPAPPAPKPETKQQEQWEKEGTALTPFALEESSVLHAKAAALAFNLAPPAKMPVYAEAAPEAAPADPLDLASNVPEDAVADPMNDAQCDEFVHALFAF